MSDKPTHLAKNSGAEEVPAQPIEGAGRTTAPENVIAQQNFSVCSLKEARAIWNGTGSESRLSGSASGTSENSQALTFSGLDTLYGTSTARKADQVELAAARPVGGDATAPTDSSSVARVGDPVKVDNTAWKSGSPGGDALFGNPGRTELNFADSGSQLRWQGNSQLKFNAAA
jgi:hypothetical protein